VIEHVSIRRDGSEFPVELSISPLKLGNAYIFSGFIHDITKRKRLEHRFRQAVESAPNAIVMVNESGMIEMVNSQAETSFGYSRSELVGQPVEMLMPERFRSAHMDFRQAYIAAPASRPMGMGRDLYGLRKDGAEFPVEIGLSLIDSEEEILVMSTIVEITARKAAEQKIRQAQINLAIAQSEIKIAQRIQASLSPSAPIKSEHFEVTGYCLPADQVGGDYFDYFFRNEDQLDMIIADVSGHSIGPALFMVETRSAIRTQANGLGTPAETLNVLNNFLFEDLDKADYFITLFYLQYDITNHQLSFANAGHPPPLLLSPFQDECRQLDAEGLILGINKKVIFEEKTTTLFKGDLILLYTDGITEAENANGEFFGIERVSDIFIQHSQQTPQKIIDALLEQLKQFRQNESFNDDITLMVFKCG
jgi:PAS domain S-box-containing protein